MKILLLANRPSSNSQAATVTEYLDAFHSHSHHEIYEISMMGRFPSRIDLDQFDAVILHYSLSVGPMIKHYLGVDLVARLKRFRGLKIAFLQDEYREIQTYWKHINELGLNILFSCVPVSELEKVYPKSKVPDVTVVNVLTGYVSNQLIEQETSAICDRTIDVGYRSRKMPFWLGKLGWEKRWIASEFSLRAQNCDIKTDISVNEGDRLYGSDWTNFLGSCRAILGTESGASIIDYDGKLEKQVDEYVARFPAASFDEVFDLFLREFEGSLKLHQVSPRCFEAAALRTPMILFEGSYSNLLEPDRHYIPLKKDFSNFDDVIAKLSDTEELQTLAERTYQEVALNQDLNYKAFIKKVDTAIDIKCEELGFRLKTKDYTQSQFRSDLRRSYRYYLNRKLVISLQYLMLGMPWTRRGLFDLWFKLPLSIQRFIRPMTKIISR